ncbi:MAG: hypothetical protein OSJ52_09795 [Lachnospiraceae bacterium]|nr:hypothetical protein [Lachnospiraceae bacterium]
MSGIGAVSTTWEIGAARAAESAGSVYTAAPVGKVGATTLSQTVGTKETKETQKAECQTCKERKYMDQSNEGDVSFQAPTHIAPGQAAAKVMSHEREHVQNAVAEGQKENKRLVSVSVSLKTGVCPECGKTYIAGGTTRTKMLTYRENPYDQGRKAVEGTMLRGMNFDQKL